MIILGIIIVLAAIQSLFGVGILLFGTPILLILGYEYTDVLLNLLPASAAISWSQVWDYRTEKLDGSYRGSFFLYCIPLLITGMFLTIFYDLQAPIKIFVTVMLFAAFILRSFDSLRFKLQKIMQRRLKLALGSMGLIHGLSNMGGSILTPLVSSIYQDKNRVLAGVSFDYAFMASFQLFIVLVIQRESFLPEYLIGSALALAVRYSIGKKVFSFTKDELYQKLLNGFILANAIVLFLSFK